MRARDRRRYEAVQKLGGKCEWCKRDDWRLLDFHHKPGTVKVAGLRVMFHSPDKYDIDAELEKCVLYCRSCHALQHTNLPRFP